MDTEKFRCQKFISDIGGKDIEAHNNDISKAIIAVRNWLGTYSKALIPGPSKIEEKYSDFLYQLPQQCRQVYLVPKELTFVDYRLLAEEWLEKYDDEIGII